MFHFLSFVGVASAAIIESRPHEHLQMANAQLQNATEAVIKTAAVAGLAYAGAYMAAAGATPGAYDSSRRSQASSTGQRYCDSRETDPLKYKCTADYFNGAKVNNADVAQAKVAIRNYWCCPGQDLGGKYIGDLNGVCVSQNNGNNVFAQDQGVGGCVYHGPCVAYGGAIAQAGSMPVPAEFVSMPAGAGTPSSKGASGVTADVGSCGSNGNDGNNDADPVSNSIGYGIFGAVPGGYNYATVDVSDVAALIGDTRPNQGGTKLGGSSGLARSNGVLQPQCCIKTDQGKDGTLVYDLTPSVLVQPISFCTLDGFSNPDYTCGV